VRLVSQRWTAALLLAALSAAACANGAPASETRRSLQLIVHECYSGAAVSVAVDGQPLALTPPVQRDDSVAVCYNQAREVGARVRVRVRSPGGEQLVELTPDAQSRYLLITPRHAPYAALAHDAPLLD
jgi:hypothetical protein